jgi:integrase/recombinase XerD
MRGAVKSCLSSSIDRYIKFKQALGRDFTRERRVLAHLSEFLNKASATNLTQTEFDDWCKTQLHLSSGLRRNRMQIVRNFLLYRRRTEPICFVPDDRLFPIRHQVVRPHIFSELEIARLLQATEKVPDSPRLVMRPLVLRLAVVLLYTTGLRRRELVRLTLDDYDQRERALLIRETKFHKSRYLPLSADASREIKAYLAARKEHRLPMLSDSPLFWSGRAAERSLSVDALRNGMRTLCRLADVRKSDGQLPRIHDYRHSFAVSALLRWYRSGVDVQAKLPLLATYMGHVSIVSTEYYLPFIPDLALAASDRFCGHYGMLIKPSIDGGGS